MTDLAFKRVVLKISGEGLCREGGSGIDNEELQRIGREIKQVADLGVQLAVVVGGGNIVRGNELAAATNIDPATAHYMGMMATVINSLAIQEMLEELGQHTRVQSAIGIERVCERFIRRRCIRHLEKNRVVILAAGTGNPFVTTDTCASLRAVEISADVLLKATKVGGVYSDDPKVVKDATLFETMTYADVIDKRLKVMDVSAVDMCEQHNVPIIVFSLRQPGNMKRAVMGEKIGTRIGK